MKKQEQLTSEETNELVRLLKKVRLPAPYPVFLALCQSVTMVAANLAVMPDKNRILLTHRKDEFYNNWHIPGSILLTGERPEEAGERVAKNELGIDVFDLRFVNYFYVDTPRGSEINFLFIVKAKGEPKDGQYFSLDEIGNNLIEEQKEQIEYLKNIKI